MGKYYSVSFTNDLSHYGISGQKWGIRRFQYDNGSYTPEGKERYGRVASKGISGSSGKVAKGLFWKKKEDKVQLQQLQEEVKSAFSSNHEFLDNIHNKEKDFISSLHRVGDKYAEYFKNADISSADKEKIWEKLHSDFGDGTDDEDYLFNTAVEYLHDPELWKRNTPKELSSERIEIDNKARELASDINKISDPIIEKYKDKKVEYNHSEVDTKVETLINSIVRDNALDNTWLTYYLFNGNSYTSDSSFYESPAYWDTIMRLADEFTDGYNKRYGK